MQTKNYNSYRITHKNGNIEEINASNLIEALENLTTTEEASTVLQTFMVKENIKTLVEDEPTEVIFSSVVAEGAGGSIATPSSGVIHVGDQLAFKAIPARTYKFVSWSRNGEVISTNASFVYTMTELAEGEDTAVFTATFELDDVSWTSEVSPEGATGAGCVAFPVSGTAKANSTLGLIAVEAEGYIFDHWERNGTSIGTNKILSVTVSPLASDEESCVFKAVFTES